MAKTATRKACKRCAGRGYFETFAHVWQGTCFRCLGTGVEPKIPAAVTRQAEARFEAFCGEASALYRRLGNAARQAMDERGFSDPQAKRLLRLERRAWARYERRAGKYETFVPRFVDAILQERTR